MSAPDYDRRGGATLREVANALGVSHERVRQIERDALAKLRRGLAREGLTFDDLCPPDRGEWLEPAPESPWAEPTLPTQATGVNKPRGR